MIKQLFSSRSRVSRSEAAIKGVPPLRGKPLTAASGHDKGWSRGVSISLTFMSEITQSILRRKRPPKGAAAGSKVSNVKSKRMSRQSAEIMSGGYDPVKELS